MKIINRLLSFLLSVLCALPLAACANDAIPVNEILTHIQSESIRSGVPVAAIKAVIKNESHWNPNAVSNKGAVGLMQLMPDTATRFGVRNPYDPMQNITGGTRYLAWLANRFNGNWQHVFAGYNAGEGRIDQYGGIPPYPETINYVRNVMSDFNVYSRWGNQPATSITYQAARLRTSNNTRPNIYLLPIKAATAPSTVQWNPPFDYYQ